MRDEGLPPGFTEVGAPAPPSRRPSFPTLSTLPRQPYTATGDVVDGDTIRLNNDLVGRLFGIDAPERGQMGYRQGQPPINLGDLSTNTLSQYIRPSQPAYGTGKQSYGRPVITLGDGLTDPARTSLLSGTALAAPSFMGADPERRGRYMEDERLARINRQGMHQTEYMSPDIYRSAKRWNQKLRPDEEMVWSSDLPELRPEFQRVPTEKEQKFFNWLGTQYGRKDFSQADLDGFWKGEGYTASEVADEKFLQAIRDGERVGALDYSSWDAQTLRDFKMKNGFAGLRPEVQEAYNALLNDPGSNPDSLQQFADVNGLTFDPRDVKEFYEKRARGENPMVPIPIINPGDGAKGAAGRGFVDPFGFLDEMGAGVDAVAPQWMQSGAQWLTGGPESFKHRETVWNSDRDFGDIYRNNLRQNRAIIDYDETNHPYARAGGQLASSVLIPYGGGIRGVGNFAKVGAAEGGLYAFGSADGNLMNRLTAVPGGATLGAVLGGTVGKGQELLSPVLKSSALKLGEAFRARLGNRAPMLADPLNPAAGLPMLPPPGRVAGDIAPDAAPGSLAPSMRSNDDLPEGFAEVTDDMLPPIPGQRANMDADNALPSLSSPRIRDMIDIGATRPGRLLDGPTDEMLQANAARVRPADVLPRPANEVQSLDEFNRISEGLYPPVAAPRERDYLTSRQYPSPTNPAATLSRRGPPDLVTFARTQRGLRDEGGELTASGLSNAARKGEDFAGGEAQLGRLIDNENGLSLEEFGQRAARAGYFDHVPTNDEIAQALGDTYRGSNRLFRADDYGEIDAFNAARDTRHAVERSRQEGAPLADDMGQPATYDDIVANAPPATAYDDWNNAVLSKVGNIRVDKLNSPEDISQALKMVHGVGDGFDAATRGKITHAETRDLARRMGMTEDDLLARRKGQAFNAEEAYASKVLLAKAQGELVQIASRIQRSGGEPGVEAEAMFRQAVLRVAAIQEHVAAMTSEAGRALSSFRMAANSRDIPGHILRDLASGPGGTKRLNQMADTILDLERDPGSLNQFVMKAVKPTFTDKLVELMYNFRLSGPQTHAVNILSNTMTALAQIPEHLAGAGVGTARKAFFRSEADRILLSDVGQRAIGMMQGAWEGLGAAKTAWRTGEAADFVGKVETQQMKAISGRKGDLLRMPTRALTAEDEFFKAVARRGQLAEMAGRQARKEGLKGQDYRDRIAELVADPPDDMLAKSLDFARYVTFQKQLGPIASRISAITNDYPALKIIIPFVRTPSNLMKFAVERSPAAPLMREWRDQVRKGGPDGDLAIARMMMGSGIGAIVAQLAADGKITGSLPKDETKANILLAQGWKPYSIKIGDEWVSYQRLDPFGTTIGTAADMATLGEGMSDKQLEDYAMLTTASIANNLASKTWLSGVSDALYAIRDPQRYGPAFLRKQISGLVVPAAASQLARTTDPTLRETPDIGSAIQARIPGLSDNLLPRRDVWGREQVNEDAPGPDIVSPLWTSRETPDPIGKEILRVGASASKPSAIVGKSKLTPEQYDALQREAGPVRRRWLDQLFASPGYAEADDEGKADLIKKVMSAGRSAARDNVLSGTPIPDMMPEKRGRGSRKEAQPDDLPAGFVEVQ